MDLKELSSGRLGSNQPTDESKSPAPKPWSLPVFVWNGGNDPPSENSQFSTSP